MADEEFAELGEINLSHELLLRSGAGPPGRCAHGGGAVWGRSPGSILPISQYRSMYATEPSRAAEAEDIMGHYGSRALRTKAGLYYSPPGTSYTIVERPPPPHVPLPQPPKPRGTYLGSNNANYRPSEYRSSSPSNNYRNQSGHTNSSSHSHSHVSKKGPLSPEQVLKMLTSGIGSNKSGDSEHHHHHPRHRRLTPPDIDQLPVRTINMNRSSDANHGFGICVKGGANNPGTSLHLFQHKSSHDTNL